MKDLFKHIIDFIKNVLKEEDIIIMLEKMVDPKQRKSYIKDIKNQKILEFIVENDNNFSVRIEALKFIKSRKFLEKALLDENKQVQRTANKRLKELKND